MGPCFIVLPHIATFPSSVPSLPNSKIKGTQYPFCITYNIYTSSWYYVQGYLVANGKNQEVYCHKCTIHCHVATSLILVVLWQCPGPVRLQLARDQLCGVRARDWHQYLESRSGGSSRSLFVGRMSVSNLVTSTVQPQ